MGNVHAGPPTYLFRAHDQSARMPMICVGKRCFDPAYGRGVEKAKFENWKERNKEKRRASWVGV